MYFLWNNDLCSLDVQNDQNGAVGDCLALLGVVLSLVLKFVKLEFEIELF